MARRGCPRGVICTDKTTVWLTVFVIAVLVAVAWFFAPQPPVYLPPAEPKIVVVHAPPQQQQQQQQQLPYPEPVVRGLGIPSISVRGPVGQYQQVGVLAGEGGSAGSAAPDRTVLPLYGRELDARRGRWNYYTRTDGNNPVQVPVRVRNRVCDDDMNGCDELSSGDSVHVPVLGRSFSASVYQRSIFR